MTPNIDKSKYFIRHETHIQNIVIKYIAPQLLQYWKIFRSK